METKAIIPIKINTTERSSCVLCNGQLQETYVLKNHSCTYTPSYTIEESISTPIVDISIGQCAECKSLQLMSLIPPELLYKNPHTGTQGTPTWKEHHKQFYEFCKPALIKSQSPIEIGGHTCCIATPFKNEFPDRSYTVMDMIQSPICDERIPLINANCESYKYTTEDTVLMSHVFEHLYKPGEFLKKLQESPSVKSVLISVPNLKFALDVFNLSIINLEHTYYFDENDIIHLFKKNGFKCHEMKAFGNHSVFYWFEKSDEKAAVPVSRSPSDTEALKIYYKRREEYLASIQIPDNDQSIYIIPAGHYGILIYDALVARGYKDRIRGFLDNDKYKQYFAPGTGLPVLPISALPCDVIGILYAGPYSNELHQNLLAIQPNNTYIFI